MVEKGWLELENVVLELLLLNESFKHDFLQNYKLAQKNLKGIMNEIEKKSRLIFEKSFVLFGRIKKEALAKVELKTFLFRGQK